MSRASLLWSSILLAGVLTIGAAVTYRLVADERSGNLPRDRGEAVLYVALGDSTVRGVGASEPERTYVAGVYERLRVVYPGARVVNLGASGATAADVVEGQLANAVGLAPHLVTLSVGPNDITDRRDLEQYAQDVQTILSTLRQRTTALVVVSLIPDLSVTPRFRGTSMARVVGRRAEQFNETLGRSARSHGALVVDLFAFSRAEVPSHPELVAADGYHPSDAGHARWAALMWEAIAPRVP